MPKRRKDEAPNTKRFTFKSLKATDEGKVQAVFATLKVVDSDGDRLLNGAVGDQTVIMSGYGHASWMGGLDGLPVGKGRVFERGDDAVFEGEFFLDTVAGKETFLTVKGVGPLQEWSFALPEIDGVWIEEGNEMIRDIKRVRINEVSPVLMGAGVNTRTLTVKSGDQKTDNETPASRTFVSQLDETVETVERAISRAVKVNLLANEEGRQMGRRSLRRVRILKDALHEAEALLDGVLDEGPEVEDPNSELKKLAQKYEGE